MRLRLTTLTSILTVMITLHYHADVHAAQLVFENNQSRDIYVGVAYYAIVDDSAGPFNGTAPVARAVGFWRVEANSHRVLDLPDGYMEEIWLHIKDQKLPLPSITLRETITTFGEVNAIVPVDPSHRLTNYKHLRVGTIVASVINRGIPLTFYKTRLEGGGQLRFTLR